MELARRLRDVSKEEARESYEELKALPCESIGKNARTGLACLDYFLLRHRLKAKTKRHISFYEATKDKELMAYIDEKIAKIKKKTPSELSADGLLKYRYDVFQLYYGTINQFRPSEAKRLYCRFQPKHGILDFSAGWGGRCLAAMASGIPYIGIDANVKMRPAYEQMIRTVDPDAKVTMIFQPSESVDFSRFSYDLVFTSPPYFMLEEYEKMPQYGSQQGFLDTFFRPVVASAWKNLKTPGYLALNMPKTMYDAVKQDLPPLWKRLQLPVASRHPSNAAAGRPLGDKNVGQRTEGIYVWKKGGRATRKVSSKRFD
jgi:hypothetical protein